MKLGDAARPRRARSTGDRARDLGPSLRDLLLAVLAHAVEAQRGRLVPASTPPTWTAPVPDPRQVFAIALNYAPHAAEAGYTPPELPLVFTKFPSWITGPDTTVALPEGNVDWEVEVVAVMGTGGRDIAEADAWDALAGLTIGQDLSERCSS